MAVRFHVDYKQQPDQSLGLAGMWVEVLPPQMMVMAIPPRLPPWPRRRPQAPPHHLFLSTSPSRHPPPYKVAPGLPACPRMLPVPWRSPQDLLAWGLGGESQVARVADSLLHGCAAAEGAGVGVGRSACVGPQVTGS